jgi:hypothetical protein
MVWALPLLTIKLSPDCLTPVLVASGIRSLTEFGSLGRPLVQPVLYHQSAYTRLGLNLFRRERAITEFD